MAFEKTVNKFLVLFPRSEHYEYDSGHIKIFLDSNAEKLNVIGGKKILTPKQRWKNEIEKRNALNGSGALFTQINSYELKYGRIPQIDFERVDPTNLKELFPNLPSDEKDKITGQMFSIVKAAHEAGIELGDPQLRNFSYTNKNIIGFDLEAEWIYEGAGKVLDLIVLATDITASNDYKDNVLEMVEKYYGSFERVPLNWHMRSYFKSGWKISNEFLNYFTGSK